MEGQKNRDRYEETDILRHRERERENKRRR